jgi:hypothetical protein
MNIVQGSQVNVKLDDCFRLKLSGLTQENTFLCLLSGLRNTRRWHSCILSGALNKKVQRMGKSLLCHAKNTFWSFLHRKLFLSQRLKYELKVALKTYAYALKPATV